MAMDTTPAPTLTPQVTATTALTTAAPTTDMVTDTTTDAPASTDTAPDTTAEDTTTAAHTHPTMVATSLVTEATHVAPTDPLTEHTGESRAAPIKVRVDSLFLFLAGYRELMRPATS